MSQASSLLESLAKEIDNDQREEAARFLSDLYLFVHARDESDEDGLEQKLDSAGREAERQLALVALEHFQMLLETYKDFPSGQKLFGFFLAQIHDVFCYQISGKNLTDHQIDEIIQLKIIDKITADMGDGFTHFALSPRHVRGMIYFLADRCYIRWDRKCSA